jgi:hypothetical protein
VPGNPGEGASAEWAGGDLDHTSWQCAGPCAPSSPARGTSSRRSPNACTRCQQLIEHGRHAKARLVGADNEAAAAGKVERMLHIGDWSQQRESRTTLLTRLGEALVNEDRAGINE